MKLACFTILHYKTFKETVRCVQSLLQLSMINECQILIYDNGSQDGSYEKLDKKYKNFPIIVVKKNIKNEGFSKGNNQAYMIAKTYAPCFIIALNNDIQIKQRNFLEILKIVAAEDSFYFIGPDIYAPYTKEHQSPLYETFPSRSQTDNEMDYYNEILRNIEAHIYFERKQRFLATFRYYLPDIVIKLFRNTKKVLGAGISKNIREYKKCHVNPVLQGSCIIVTELYIKSNDLLFEPDTRFYFEELLLALKCLTLNYKTIYTPELQVIHNHGKATRARTKSVQNYLIFNAESMLKGYNIYVKTLEDNPWQKNH